MSAWRTGQPCVRMRYGARDEIVTVDAAMRVYGTAASLLSVASTEAARRRLLIGDVLEARGVRVEILAEFRHPMTDDERWVRELIERARRGEAE